MNEQPAKTTIKTEAAKTILKIYDPAMCCSSGVCGPSVDPALTQFAGTLKHIEAQRGISVERYNLGQQPQAFVDNASVKSMLGNGGDRELPFIFIDDQLWLKGRYPSRTELDDALKIKSDSVPSPFAGQTTHEASALQDDLRRAGIEPYGWSVNRSLAFSGTQDPVLCAKSRDELCYIDEILNRHAQQNVISPWVPEELNRSENLKILITDRIGGPI